MPPDHPRQRVEPLLDRGEPDIVDDDRVGVAAGVEGQLAEPVDQRIRVLQEARQLRIDSGQVGATTDRNREPIGGRFLLTAAGVGEGQRGPGDAGSVTEPEPLGLQLGILAGPDTNGFEVVDKIARPLQLCSPGARRAPGGNDRLGCCAPGLNRCRSGGSRRCALGAAERIEHFALPAAAQHPMARPLRGDVDAEVAELAKHRLGYERTIDAAGCPTRRWYLARERDQVVVRNPELGAAGSQARARVVEHSGDACGGRTRAHGLGVEPAAERGAERVDAH